MRTSSSRPRGLIAAIALYVFTACMAFAAAPSVDATLEPTQIEIGESAKLTILTSGSGTLSVSLPFTFTRMVKRE